MEIAFPLGLACAFGVIFLFVVLLLLVLRYQYDPASQAQVAEIKRTESPILCFYAVARFEARVLNGSDTTWKYFILAVKQGEIVVYPRKLNAEPFTFTPDQMRWFGRPQKYSYGKNEIWLHLEVDEGWRLLKLHLYEGTMRDFVRALKQIVPEELVIAYRRRRPYIHEGPAEAQPATQDIHGAWTLDEPVSLYLMPRFLVILQGVKVLRKIQLEAVQQIGAFRRLDQPRADGLVRFRAEEETLAFALDNHEAFAASLAEAAKRTLEGPVMQKQKKKDDGDYEDEDFE